MDIKRVKIILALIIIIAIACVAIVIVNSKRVDLEKRTIILEKTNNGASWPINEVSIPARKDLVVRKVDDQLSQMELTKEVNYDDFREYVILLYEDGFEPITELGSQNPRNLRTSIDTLENKQISWYGQKDNYQIEVNWAAKGEVDGNGQPYDYYLQVFLYDKTIDMNAELSGESLIEDIESSGEVTIISGDEMQSQE